MRVDNVLSTGKIGFIARIICEHCGHTAKLSISHVDADCPVRGVSSLYCRKCKKNSAGKLISNIKEQL